MINKIYYESDYLTKEDLNTFEDNIQTVANEIKKILPNAPTFSKKTWYDNEFVYREDIKRIEDTINNLGLHFIVSDNWQKMRDYLEESPVFSNRDLNRWTVNLNNLNDNAKMFINGKRDIFWNEFTKSKYVDLIDWDVNTTYQWEE